MLNPKTFNSNLKSRAKSRGPYRPLRWILAAAALALVVPNSGRFRAAPDSRQQQPLQAPLGFSPATFPAERRWEKRFLALPDPAHCRAYLKRLTSEPHIAGTPGDRRVTDFIFREFQRDGLNPRIEEYKVLLSYPQSVRVEIVAPEKVALAHPEPPIAGDDSTRPSDPQAQMPWNAYSPSADLTAPVIYANYGNANDYARLQRMGISVRGRFVLVRYFHSYRGGKSLEAEKQGAAGLLIYSDPADDGARRGKVYPDGPWGPEGHFQRGSDVYDFKVPGDPLTPGWASTDSARRIPQSESTILPHIPMAPLSAADARQLLARLGGPAAPRAWQGGISLTYHVGDGALRVHLALQMEFRNTPIWDVVGQITGSDQPEKLVILGNHHDAWVYGAVDPSSGTAAMLETARAFGQLVREGFRPRRTLVFASWDAEEYTLTGSTEWGEQFSDNLRRNGVVYLNVDSATSGSKFSVSMVPALLSAVTEVTQAVPDPAGSSVYDRWRRQRAAQNVRSYAVTGATRSAVPYGILGGGSDFMVFLQHNGIPSLDMIFDGPYGVYHSTYDDFDWMARFGDPGFKYHAAMSRVWGMLAMRFANADVTPFDYSIQAREVAAYLKGLKALAPPSFYAEQIVPLLRQAEQWRIASARLTEQMLQWRRGKLAPAALPALNHALMQQERALMVEGGIPQRPWFRHLIYAPLPSYEAETLPGIREALTAGNMALAREHARLLGQAMERATQAALSGLPATNP